MKVLCFPTVFPPGPYAEKMYIIYCEKTLDAVIVDPGMESFEMVFEAKQNYSLKYVAIWLTHSHWDHIVDAAKIKREFLLPKGQGSGSGVRPDIRTFQRIGVRPDIRTFEMSECPA